MEPTKKKGGFSFWYVLLFAVAAYAIWFYFFYEPKDDEPNLAPVNINRVTATPQIANMPNVAPITAFGLLSRLKGGETINIPQQGSNTNINQVSATNANAGSLLS